MAKAFRAGFHPVAHLVLPLPVGSSARVCEVEAFQCRLLAEEMASSSDCATVAGVEGFDGVGAADDPPDFDDLLSPGTARTRSRRSPTAGRSPGTAGPIWLRTPRSAPSLPPLRVLCRPGQVPRHLIPALPGSVAEGVADQCDAGLDHCQGPHFGDGLGQALGPVADRDSDVLDAAALDLGQHREPEFCPFAAVPGPQPKDLAFAVTADANSDVDGRFVTRPSRTLT